MAKTKEAPIEETAVTAPVAEQAVATTNSLEGMFADDAGAGSEQIGANDVSIPFLTILQKGSPQVDRANSKFMKEAEQGFIMNTVSGEVYDGTKGILFVPCGYNKSYVEWTPRDSGGGLVGHHTESDAILKQCTIDERGRKITPNKNVIIDTAYHFGTLLHEEGLPELCVISMYSTQLKKSRNWNTMMKRILRNGPKGPFNPPTFSQVYKLTTVGEQKDNYTWFGWKIEILTEVTSMDLYKLCKDFSTQVKDGKVRMSAPPSAVDDAAGGEHGGTGEEVPF